MIKKTLLAIATIFVLASILLIVLGDPKKDNFIFELPENHLSADNLTFTRMLSSGNGYVSLKAENAYFKRDFNEITLNNAYLFMEDDNNTFTNYSDRGIYVIDSYLSASGNVHGTYNEFYYMVDEKGSFDFNFVSGLGKIGSDVIMSDGGKLIRSDYVDYDANSQTVEFVGDVEMIFVRTDE